MSIQTKALNKTLVIREANHRGCEIGDRLLVGAGLNDNPTSPVNNFADALVFEADNRRSTGKRFDGNAAARVANACEDESERTAHFRPKRFLRNGPSEFDKRLDAQRARQFLQSFPIRPLPEQQKTRRIRIPPERLRKSANRHASRLVSGERSSPDKLPTAGFGPDWIANRQRLGDGDIKHR